MKDGLILPVQRNNNFKSSFRIWVKHFYFLRFTRILGTNHLKKTFKTLNSGSTNDKTIFVNRKKQVHENSVIIHSYDSHILSTPHPL